MKKSIGILTCLSVLILSTASYAEESDNVANAVGNGNVNSLVSVGTGNVQGQSVEADEFTGAVSYSIPFPVPPGRGNLQPNITLNYNSRYKNINSWVGENWNMDLGVVARTPQKGIIDYTMGQSFDVRLGTQSETLQYVDRLGTSELSKYGVDTFDNHYVSRYRTEVESSYSIYLHLEKRDSADHVTEDLGWVILTKDGKRYTFGNSSNALLQRTNTDGELETAQWMLTRVEDANGNTLDVTYDNNRLLDQITYQDITISFSKEQLGPHFPTEREFFAPTNSLRQKLTSILIKDSENHKLIQYDLRYKTSSWKNALQLISVTQRDGEGHSLPSTLISYYDFNGAFAAPNIHWATTSSQWQAKSTYNSKENKGYLNDQSTFIDMNGDGLSDHIVAYDNNSVFKVYFNNGSDFEDLGEASNWQDPLNCNVHECKGKLTANDLDFPWLHLMDMNGDSLPDRVKFDEEYWPTEGKDTTKLEIAFNNGSGWDEPVKWEDPYHAEWITQTNVRTGFIDLNGDGLTDRIITTKAPEEEESGTNNALNKETGTFNVYFNNGHGFDEPVTWADPIDVYQNVQTGNSDANGIGKVWYNVYNTSWIHTMIRDMNGDGLPDRVHRVNVSSLIPEASNECTMGFAVHLNRNGKGWAAPQVDSDSTFGFVPDANNYIIIDPISKADPTDPERSYCGLITDRHEFIDFNKDGFPDRIEGDRADHNFKVYLFKGSNNFVYRMSSPIAMSSPVYELYQNNTDSSSDPGNDEYGRYHISDGTNGKVDQHTRMADINGDGYPDIVHLKKGTDQYEVFNFRANALKYSDNIDEWSDPYVSQPLGALKTVENGYGTATTVEYRQAARPMPKSGKSGKFTTNLFLPFPIDVAYKVYNRDLNFGDKVRANSSIEAQRNPGMRWTTYLYRQGYYHVRHASESQSRLVRFNGFGEVEKINIPLFGETWKEYHVLSRYHQTEGDLTPPLLNSNITYNTNGFSHLSIAGRPYYNEVVTDNHALTVEESVWGVDVAAEAPKYKCLSACFPKLLQQTKVVKELGETQGRNSKVEYQYGSFGNVVEQRVFGNDFDKPLLITKTSFYSEDTFETPHLASMIDTQVQTDSQGTILRDKHFGYDGKGNPIFEEYRGEAQPLQIHRVFNDQGNLIQVTGTDGITKKTSYDNKGIFPIVSQMTMPDGDVLTTTNQFSRLSGESIQSIGPHGIGSGKVLDGFGRPIEDYIIDAHGTKTLVGRVAYDEVTTNDSQRGKRTFLKIKKWNILPNHPENNLYPQLITYGDIAGNVYQKCARAENKKYRMIKSRISEGGRIQTQTAPVYTDLSCNFEESLGTAKKYVTKQDYMGRLVQKDPPPGDQNEGSPVDKVSYQYTTVGGTLKRTSLYPNNQIREEYFDSAERLIKLIDKGASIEGTAIDYHYDDVGSLTSVTSNGKELTRLTYDHYGRKIQMWDAHLGTWQYTYDDHGRLLKQTDEMGHVVAFEYDNIGRILSKSFYLDSALTQKESYELYTYDESDDSAFDVKSGELYKVEEFDGHDKLLRRTRFSYDPLYRKTNKISRYLADLGQELIQTTEHDGLGRVVSTTYPTGESVYFQYHHLGGLEKICESADCNAQSGQVYYSLDLNEGFTEFGGIKKEIFGNGVTSEYTYYEKSLRPQSKKVSFGAQVYSNRNFTYDVNANIKSISELANHKGTGAIQNAVYDSLNRLTSYQYQGTSQTQSLTYDAFGNITKNTNSFGNKLYEYLENKPNAVHKIGDKEFTYDTNGNMLTDGDRVMHYNSQNKLVKVEMKNATVVEYAYDYTDSRVSKTVTKKDPMGKIHVATTYYLGQALEIKDNQFIFHLNHGDRRILTKSLGQLSSLGNASSSLKVPYIHLDTKPLTMIPWLMFVLTFFIIGSFRPINFVDSGLLKVKQRCHPRVGGDPVTRSTPWIPAYARMTRCFEFFLSCIYGFLQLISSYTKAMNQALHQLHHRPFVKVMTFIIIFIFTLQLPINYALAGDTGQPLANISDADYLYYHHSDHLGSSHITTEGKASAMHSGVTYKQGDLLQRFEYEPFGKEKYVLNPNLKIDPSYTGQIYDIETGLYYYKARYYDPVMGRFIQADTLVPDAKNLQAYNRYSYVMNNPFKYTDPSGHGFWSWFRSLMGAFIQGVSAVIGGFVMALNPFLGLGIIAGGNVIGGAISGGWKGALGGLLFLGGAVATIAYGAIRGGWRGALMGVVNSALNAVGAVTGSSAVMQIAVFAAGASLAYATGGWKGLATFGAGFAGAMVAKGALGGFRSHSEENDDGYELVYKKSEHFFEYKGPVARAREDGGIILADNQQTFTNGDQADTLKIYTDATKNYGPLRPSHHEYVVGRDRTFVPPGRGLGKYIDNHIFAGHTFGAFHDKFVEFCTDILGIPDAAINIPSMPHVYFVAIQVESINIFIDSVNFINRSNPWAPNVPNIGHPH